ncbi:MAG TPA: NB-ARC domain-containing protein [Leptolyngbyaceae cyanobacterium]
MNLEEVITYIDELVFAKQGRWLEEPEKVVIEAAWLDRDYKDVAKDGSDYHINLLQRRVAPKLWVLLSGILGNGEKVTKKRLRRILEEVIQASRTQEIGFKSNQVLERDSILEGVLPEVRNFYGRTPEMAMLKESLAQERCVVLTGVAGVGKSALAAKLVELMVLGSFEFNKIIWKSISYAPLLPDLIGELIKSMNSSPEIDLPDSTQARISMMFSQMQNSRSLIVLDSAESILQGNRELDSNQYGKKYKEYGNFFKRVVEEKHKSCCLLITREPFIDISRLYRKGEAAKVIKVEGLGKEALEIFRSYGLRDEDKWGELINTYRGNPSCLTIVSQKIKNFFGGSVDEFLNFNTLLMIDIFEESLHNLFKEDGHLTNLEKQILFYIAEETKSSFNNGFTFRELAVKIKEKFGDEISTSEVLDAIEGLLERSLIEDRTNNNSEIVFSLQPLVVKYVINNFTKRTLKCA